MIDTVILDLDGTILDGKLRHYTCYQRILSQTDYVPIDIDSYWQMKRERANLHQQLAMSGVEVITDEFKLLWLDLIEQPEMLRLDILQPGIVEHLRAWRNAQVRLVLATLRRFPKRLARQLSDLRLDGLFHRVVISNPNLGAAGKQQQVVERVANLNPARCLWIGDTEVDIAAARALGCPVWAVTCGLRAESYLASLSPDYLSLNLTDVKLELVTKR